MCLYYKLLGAGLIEVTSAPILKIKYGTLSKGIPELLMHILQSFEGSEFVYLVTNNGAHRLLVGKPDRKRPLGRPRRRWEDNIKMDLQEVGGGCGDWMQLA